MGAPRNWFSSVRKRFIKTSHTNINILYSPSLSDQSIITEAARGKSANLECKDSAPSSSRPIPPPRKQITREDSAATKIQAVFRGHLARRAYRALKSLVKMQALVRGAYVRKQARIALHCMHALVRLQVRVRAQQLLIKSRDD
ncbi:hypothetical protein SLEP1_g51354 [Rubroshorea leprosula]|uniref:Uncharacterized protein n=1 Tax=Rubroshorea leprosula TaxID=152421 RepID=A0AAV5M302_9ROSI|nr:hypothetical protein SLEP1_g51354 [Rubroshorea leprosula]